MTTKTQWYRLSNGVEYSKKYKLFSKYQIYTVKSGKIHKFCSRLESKVFKQISALTQDGTLTELETNLIYKMIHKEILRGEHGRGTFV